ncbi:MAG: aromatic amino acid transport family protein [bacterium]|nr:hypothetical protein [Candidatus Jorgensenbacteria bacterium]
MNRNFIFASSLLARTIIGAGIFSLPFVFYSVGFGIGMLYLFVFVLAYCAMHIMYAESIETEPEGHDFAHLARKYLGKKLGTFAVLITLIELLIVLTAYIILSQSFFSILFGMPGIYAAILFWLLGTIFIFVDLKWIERVSVGSVLFLLITAFIIFQYSLPHVFTTPTSKSLDLFVLLLPFGPLFFALNGRPGISKTVAVWRSAKKSNSPFSLRKAIIVGTLLPSLVYIIFVIGVLKLSPIPSQDAISGIANILPLWIVKLLGVFGFFAIWAPYFMIGSNIKDILEKDLRFGRWIAAWLIILIPIGLFFSGVTQFLSVIGFVGGLFLALEGIFVVTIWRRAFPKSRFRSVSYFLYLLFILSIAYEIIFIIF